MTGIVVVEGRRYRYRVAVRALALAAVLAAAVTVLGAWFATRPPSEAQLAEQRRWYEQSAAEWERSGEEQVADCRASEGTARETDPAADYGCDTMGPPRLEDYLSPTSTFAVDAPAWASLVSVFLLLLAFAGGVTFVTAELGSGAMGTWLTFVPRRGRVYASKVLVAGLGALPSTALALLLAVGGAYAVSAVNGAAGTITADGWADLSWQVVRTVGLAGVAGVVGAAVGFALRSAAAALGAAVGWFLLVDGLLAGFVPALARWALQLNITAWVQGEASYSVEVACEDVVVTGGGIGVCWESRTLTAAEAAPVLAVVAVVLVVVGGVLFRRRDVG